MNKKIMLLIPSMFLMANTSFGVAPITSTVNVQQGIYFSTEQCDNAPGVGYAHNESDDGLTCMALSVVDNAGNAIGGSSYSDAWHKDGNFANMALKMSGKVSSNVATTKMTYIVSGLLFPTATSADCRHMDGANVLATNQHCIALPADIEFQLDTRKCDGTAGADNSTKIDQDDITVAGVYKASAAAKNCIGEKAAYQVQTIDGKHVPGLRGKQTIPNTSSDTHMNWALDVTFNQSTLTEAQVKDIDSFVQESIETDAVVTNADMVSNAEKAAIKKALMNSNESRFFPSGEALMEVRFIIQDGSIVN
jgi:hypothetical protein